MLGSTVIYNSSHLILKVCSLALTSFQIVHKAVDCMSPLGSANGFRPEFTVQIHARTQAM